MRLTSIEQCFKPETLSEAVTIIRDYKGKAAIVGGGLNITTERDESIKALVYLDKIGLKHITEDEDEIRVGSRVSVNEFINSPIIEDYLNGSVCDAIREISSELLRNQMTIGGSLVKGRPFSDIATMFLALRAVVIMFDGEKDIRMSLDEFYDSGQLLNDMIIKEVCLRKYDSSHHFGMERFTRTATDIPLLNLAILLKLDNGLIEDASIASGSLKSPTSRFEKGESYLKGKKVGRETADDFFSYVRDNLNTLNDYRLSSEYRKELAGVFARRILLGFTGVGE
ncbi:MAG: FAD binding domain-containing protein [Thermoanaerobacteraceae bacterium]|nr:FAD binding domain-containing protein [Thermoanaerobacteraceae bacterium]